MLFLSFNVGYICGLDGIILKIEDINLGVVDYVFNLEVKIFLNLNNGYFFLFIENYILFGNVVVEVYDLRGRIILK